ncbi:Leptomycin B resistance protein pmd1-like protein 4 [Phlyctema vagabunda]|uniref:Leptomycin B resistance protein pmd1-like protein 4 n=1 Tax=Phlyctema vagabunda TaxID=108571 RepID=A0ABR4P856_9HELO
MADAAPKQGDDPRSRAPLEIQPGVDPEKTRNTNVLKKSFTYLRLLVAAEPTKADYGLLAVGVLAAIAAGIPFPLLGIIFGQLVDKLNSASCDISDNTAADKAAYQHAVDGKVLQVVYIAIASFVAIYVYIVSWSLVGGRLVQRLRDQYFRSLLRQEASFFDNLPAGEVSSRLNGDIATIQAGTSEKVGICISCASFFVTAYIVAFMKDAKLAGMLVSLVPAFLLMALVGSKYINKYSGQMSDHIASASSIASEGLSNVTVVHAFGANSRLEYKFSSDLMKAQKAGIKKAFATAVQTGLLYFIAYAGNALAFWQGAKTIANSVANGSSSTVGTTYTVIFILVDASIFLSQVAPYLQTFGSAAAAFEKLEKDMNHESALDGTSETTGRLLDAVSGDIKFDKVSFTYPSRLDHPVVQELSLVCPASKHTAIVGLSGSGKSTVAALITRLYDPIQGSILLDNQDIKELNLRQLRSYVSLVQQEPSLLDRSILENIALGLVNSPAAKHVHLKSILLGSKLAELTESVREGQDMVIAAQVLGSEVSEIVEMVRVAATQSDAISFIDKLEFGLATTVGSTGNLMSGGQKQRIALARALIRDPRILILDEATALLDSTSEQRIKSSMEKMAEGRTLISIAHRLSTVRNAHNIIVMRHGRVVEQGTHAELMGLDDGAYKGMVHLQSLNAQSMREPISEASSTRNSIQKNAEKEIVVAESSLDEKSEDLTAKVESKDEPEGLPSERSIWSILKTLSPLIRRYLLVLLAAFFTSTIVGAAYSAEAIIFGQTVGSLSPCKTPERIRSRGNLFGLLFFMLAIAEFFANAISWSAFGVAAEKILYKVRVLSFRSLFEQDLQWHQSEGRNPALLLSYITKDGNALGGLTGSIIGTIFSIAVNLIVAIVMAHIIAWKIAIVCLVTVPILLGAGIMQIRVLTQFEERHSKAFEKSTGITVEAINSIKTVASLSLEHEILRVYRRSLKAPRTEITKASLYANLWLAIAHSVGNLVYALAYWWGAKQILTGKYSQVQFFTVLLALLVSAQLWGQMFFLAPDLSRSRAAVARILNLIDLGSTKISSSKSVLENDLEAKAQENRTSISENQGGVEILLRNVTFSYPARPHIQVLDKMDLHIKPGQFCALVGPSGAGKSTIISLIERMYTPSEGNISINGTQISQSSVSFRDEISLVPQDSVLFDGSIRFNVSLGARPGQEVSDAQIEEACRLANIHDTIISLPQGYDTNCGPNGNQLSGGQKQRLSIARALVRKPRLLLLDESTSALDAESEKLLQDGLEKASKGITVVAIAHRLHTIKKADVIFVIEGGRCVDAGTHNELFERSESYRINAMHQTFDA